MLALVLALAACAGGTGDERPAAPTGAAAGTATTGTTASGEAPAGSPTGCAGRLAGPDTRRYRDDVGDDDPDLVSLDVYRRPGATGCPALVWVHGGGWRRGDKAGRTTDTKAAFAGDLGAALVSVNYRLVTPGGDVRWPVTGEDVAAAVAWVLDHAGELGIDPTRVVLLGHSAGAHLVSIVATHPRLLADAGASREDVRCVVALDSAAFEITAEQVARSELFADAFGDDPATLADASPTVQAREHPGGIADFLVVTRGSPARLAESEAFAAAVTAAGASARVLDAGDYTHEQVNTELGVPGEQVVTPPTRAFLEGCFA